MKAQERYFSTGISCFEPQRRWGRKLFMLALTALALWLLSGCSEEVSGFKSQVSSLPNWGRGLVMGLVIFFSAAGLWLAVWWTRENNAFCAELTKRQMQRKQRALRLRREFSEQADWPHDVPEFTVGPLEQLSEAATVILPRETVQEWAESRLRPALDATPLRGDLASIYGALVINLCEARDLVRKAQTNLAVDDYGEKLAMAERKLGESIRAVAGLLEGNQRERSEA